MSLSQRPKRKRNSPPRLRPLSRLRRSTSTHSHNYSNLQTYIDKLTLLLIYAMFTIMIFGVSFGTVWTFRWMVRRVSTKERVTLTLPLVHVAPEFKVRDGGRVFYRHMDWDLYDTTKEMARERRRRKVQGLEPLVELDSNHSNIDRRESHIDKDLPSFLTNYTLYSQHIMTYGCAVTVLLLDPRVPMREEGDSLWFALESVAAFITPKERTCVLIQTSSCEVSHTSNQSPEQYVAHRIYAHALPLFQQMITQGNVRLSFPNPKTYHFQSCTNFYNPSSAFMNLQYWQNEFLNVDSDTILILQDDAVICHKWNVQTSTSRNYAYIGGVWMPNSGPLNPIPSEGVCAGMKIRWHTWTTPGKRKRQIQQYLHNQHQTNTTNIHNVTLTFPDICNGGNGLAPIGNGGLSLRSRTWMMQAIRSCPHHKYSGLPLEPTRNDTILCRVYDDLNEDLYFATILRGINAPLPTAWEASIFAMEMLWPEEVLELYGHDGKLGLKTHMRYMNGHEKNQKEFFSELEDLFFQGVSSETGEDFYTVPIGMHKVWWYHSNHVLLGEDVNQLCPFLKYVFDTDDSKWKNKNRLGGI